MCGTPNYKPSAETTTCLIFFCFLAERMDQNKTHKAAIDACSNKPHHLPVIRKKHVQEKENLGSRLEQELVQLDQKLVLELDRVVADQQTTMQVFYNNKTSD
jgi:diadenosine tetraphosphate (Ap4A) HIT family hydrolase